MLRPRLLAGSLVVAAVASVGIGWAIAQNRNDTAAVVIDGGSEIPEPPTIGTNAVVKGTPLPDVDVQTLGGDSLALASLTGQPLVINVWGSTCVPCRKELPDFAAAHLQFGDQVRFIGVSFLPPSEREESFARDRGVQYELLYDADGSFVDAVGIAAFPVTLFVAADGTIVRQSGQLNRAELTEIIEGDLL